MGEGERPSIFNGDSKDLLETWVWVCFRLWFEGERGRVSVGVNTWGFRHQNQPSQIGLPGETWGIREICRKLWLFPEGANSSQ